MNIFWNRKPIKSGRKVDKQLRFKSLKTNINSRQTIQISIFFSFPNLQASRLIVTFDEHVISNNFKFGVIYQKFGQVSNTAGLFNPHPSTFCIIFHRNQSLSENIQTVVTSDFLSSFHCPPDVFSSITAASNARSPLLRQSQPRWGQR